MASILDIAPITASVTIREKVIPIYGVGAEGIVYLLNRFPVLRMIMTGRELQDLTMDALIALAPDAVDAIIAAGMGYVGKDHEEQVKVEEVIHALSLDEQVQCLSKVFELTMPRGVGPFVEMLSSLGGKAAAGGWAAVMKSAEQSSSASPTGTASNGPGSTHRVNLQDGSSSLPVAGSESAPNS